MMIAMSSSKTKRTVLTLDTLDEALEELSRHPDTVETRALRTRGEALRVEITAWTADAPPSAQEREAEMQRVLAFYMEVQRVSRGS